jgi:hypothetical protein
MNLGAKPSTLVSKTVVLLHVVRAALFVISCTALIGAALLARSLSWDRGARPALLMLFFLAACAIALIWYCLDGMAFIAPIFAIRNGYSAARAIAATVGFVGDRFGAVLRVSALFVTVHALIFFFALSLLSAPMAVAGALPPSVAFFISVLVILLYFVAIDFLRVAKLAAYICIANSSSGHKQQPVVMIG